MRRDELLEMIHALCWALHHLPEGTITVTEADAVLLEGVRLMRREGRDWEVANGTSDHVAEARDTTRGGVCRPAGGRSLLRDGVGGNAPARGNGRVPVECHIKPLPRPSTFCSVVSGSMAEWKAPSCESGG